MQLWRLNDTTWENDDRVVKGIDYSGGKAKTVHRTLYSIAMLMLPACPAFAVGVAWRVLSKGALEHCRTAEMDCKWYDVTPKFAMR